MGYKVLLAQDVSESGKELLKENGCEVILAGGSGGHEGADQRLRRLLFQDIFPRHFSSPRIF